MRKSAVLLLALIFCSCKSRQLNVTHRTENKRGGSVAAAAGNPAGGSLAVGTSVVPGGGGKVLGNDNLPTLFPVRVEGKYGYIDKKGKLVIQPQFSGASRFSEGLAAVQMQRAGRVGYIDETGNLVIPLQFDLADPFSEGLAAIFKDRKWGFMDRTGQVVVAPAFAAVARFTEGMAVVGILSGSIAGYTYINRKGEPQTDSTIRFEVAMPFGDGLAPVRSLGEKIRYVDQSLKTVIAPQFMAAGEFSEGMAPVQVRAPEGMRWGFIDKTGKMAIPAHYYEALPFLEGLAGVKVPSGKWGFINQKDKMIIIPKYDSVAPFDNGMAQVYVGEGLGYIDLHGKYVWEPK